AVIVASDHSQAAVEDRIHLDRAFADFDVATQSAASTIGAEVALSPAQRSAMVYALDQDRADQVIARAIEAVSGLEGVDLILSLNRPNGDAAVVRSPRGEFRSAPGGGLEDERG